MDIDLNEVKTFCKAKGFTLNHYYMAILSKTIHDYMIQQKSLDIPKDVLVGFPINMRPPISSMEDV